MKRIFKLFKALTQIKWNTVSMIICATPLVLIFALVFLSVFTSDEISGSVVSNHEPCALIGQSFLEEGGSIVDAAIGTMLCEGVKLPNRAGIGGGFTALLYVNGQVKSLTATPVVPQKFPEGFLNASGKDVEGAKAGGVPGELLGYWELHQRYGLLPWKSLFQPTIAVCESGVPASSWQEYDLERSKFYMYRSKTMRELYQMLNANKVDNTFKFLAYAETLKKIAQNGPDIFYKGEVGKKFVEDIQSDGGYLTESDLRNYRTVWSSKTVKFHLPRNLNGYTTPLPSMGAAVALAMNIVKAFKVDDKPLFWHKAIEAMKHALGRSTQLSDISDESNATIKHDVEKLYRQMQDPEYATNLRKFILSGKTFHDKVYYGMKSSPTQAHGTANICVLSPQGDAIVMSSSLMWDSKTFFWSKKTGIIFNSLMRNFLPVNSNSTHSSEYVKPGKRALTPHCPVIVVNKFQANVHFLLGASGSDMIPSQVITGLIYYVMLQKDAYTATNSGLLVPNVFEDIVDVSDGLSKELDFGEGVLEYLAKSGHTLLRREPSNRYIIRTCIGRSHQIPEGEFTYREHGRGVLVEPLTNLNMFIIVLLFFISMFAIMIVIIEIRKTPR